MGVYRIRHVSETKYIQAVINDSSRTYRTLIQAVEKPVLYAMPWWLDMVCGEDGWQAIIVQDEDQQPTAIMPYHITQIKGMSAVITPSLTQWMPLMHVGAHGHTDIAEVVGRLPHMPITDISIQSIPPSTESNSWPGMGLKYSFLIYPDQPLEAIRAKYNEGLRRNLRSAHDSYLISSSDDIHLFLTMFKASRHQQKAEVPPWTETLIPAVYRQLVDREQGSLEIAFQQGRPIAGILTAHDHQTSYYLAGGRQSGEEGVSAHALLLDHAIQRAIAQGKSFDFEGSMHPGIANFFQSFGARPQAYWHLRKYSGFGRVWALFQK